MRTSAGLSSGKPQAANAPWLKRPLPARFSDLTGFTSEHYLTKGLRHDSFSNHQPSRTFAGSH
jgi:hypothetical protein